MMGHGVFIVAIPGPSPLVREVLQIAVVVSGAGGVVLPRRRMMIMR